jgi:cell division protease FtsH
LNRSNKYLALWIIIPLVIFTLYTLFDQKPESATNISYTEFLGMVDADKVSKVVIQDQELSVSAVYGRRFKVFTPKDGDLIMILKQKGVSIQAIPPVEPHWYISLLISGLPMLLLIGVMMNSKKSDKKQQKDYREKNMMRNSTIACLGIY